MTALLKGLFLSCVVVALTGCGGVAGHWTLDSIKPESGKNDFHMGTMCLTKEGNYAACATYGGETKSMAGTYKYDCAKKTLTFLCDGKERVYHVELMDLGKTMKVTEAGKDWVAMMKKGECTCGKCDPAKCSKECPEKKSGSAKTEAKPAEKKAEQKKVDTREPAKDKPKEKETKKSGEKK